MAYADRLLTRASALTSASRMRYLGYLGRYLEVGYILGMHVYLGRDLEVA